MVSRVRVRGFGFGFGGSGSGSGSLAHDDFSGRTFLDFQIGRDVLFFGVVEVLETGHAIDPL